MMEALERFLARLEEVTGYKPRRSGSQYTARCPAHCDKNPSLSVSRGNKTDVVIYCHAGCLLDEILERLNLTKKDLSDEKRSNKVSRRKELRIMKVYGYQDEHRNALYEVVRLEGKDFRQRRKSPDGHFIWGLSKGEYFQSDNGDWLKSNGRSTGRKRQFPAVRKVLYKLPELLAAIRDKHQVFIVEGEKDVETLLALGIAATTWPGGASKGKSKWDPAYNEWFAGAEVVILPDNDEPGKSAAESIASEIVSVAASVKLLPLPGLPPKGDVSDWLEIKENTPKNLLALVESTPNWQETQGRTRDSEVILGPEDTASAPFTDLAFARLLQHQYGDSIRHSDQFKGGWLVWDGQRWHPNEKQVVRCVQELPALLEAERDARGLCSEKLLGQYDKSIHLIQKTANIKAVMEQTRALKVIDANNVVFDNKPWYLNCPNGTVDLRSGKLMDHDRSHYITKLCPTSFYPDAEAPRWLRFLDEIFGGDLEVIAFVQRALGYALTGDISHQAFFVLTGEGANGKTTLLSTFQEVLGPDYAQQACVESLLTHKVGRHTAELSQLRGIRFLHVSEPPRLRDLNTALLKALTGGELMRARGLYQDSFEFRPELKMFWASNSYPQILDQSLGMWRRIHAIHLSSTFTGKRRDLHLWKTLLAEREGILAWAIQGAIQAGADLNPPRSVVADTEDFRNDQAIVGQFLDECCEKDSGAKVLKSDLYKRYVEWCGRDWESKKAFGVSVAELGIRSGRAGGKHYWYGIRLKSVPVSEACLN